MQEDGGRQIAYGIAKMLIIFMAVLVLFQFIREFIPDDLGPLEPIKDWCLEHEYIGTGIITLIILSILSSGPIKSDKNINNNTDNYNNNM